MEERLKLRAAAMGWYSMYFSPERQPNSEPKAEDNYKS